MRLGLFPIMHLLMREAKTYGVTVCVGLRVCLAASDGRLEKYCGTLCTLAYSLGPNALGGFDARAAGYYFY